MKQILFSSLLAATVLGLAACGNDSNSSGTTGTGDTAGTTTSTTTTGTSDAGTASSAGSYAAFADSVERNSAAGYYVNPRTGKKLSLKVDRQTGAVTDDGGEPVWRYVDNRNWWVYGWDENSGNWNQQGEAKMDGSKNTLTYKGEGDAWSSYDERWSSDDEKKSKGWKTKYGDTKIKVGKDGDVKIKDESGKVKYDADDNKVKTDKDN